MRLAKTFQQPFLPSNNKPILQDKSNEKTAIFLRERPVFNEISQIPLFFELFFCFKIVITYICTSKSL